MKKLLNKHKTGKASIYVRFTTQVLADAVNRCARAEGKTQRDFCIDALEQSIKDHPLRLGMKRIETKLNEGVPSRPDEAAALAEHKRNSQAEWDKTMGAQKGGQA